MPSRRRRGSEGHCYVPRSRRAVWIGNIASAQRRVRLSVMQCACSGSQAGRRQALSTCEPLHSPASGACCAWLRGVGWLVVLPQESRRDLQRGRMHLRQTDFLLPKMYGPPHACKEKVKSHSVNRSASTTSGSKPWRSRVIPGRPR